MKVEKECVIQATETQRHFLDVVLNSSEYTTIGFGGARGGGKTFISCLAMVLRRLQHPQTNGLMIRRIQRAADRNLGEEIKKIIWMLGLPYGEDGGIRWNETKKEFRFPNGSVIVLGYCKNAGDWEQYQGLQYTDIVIEEANQFPEKDFDNIRASNRASVFLPGLIPRVWLTFNPGGIGSEWTARRFGITEPYKPEKGFLFIKSLLKNSKALLEQDPGYRDRVLANQPEWRRKQWEEGDFDVVEGAFFHVDPSIFREMDVPYYAEIYAGVDAGYYPSSFACVWIAVWTAYDEERREKTHIHVCAEFKRARLNAIQQAEEVKAIERTDRVLKTHRVRARFADPSAWRRTEGEGGISLTMAYLWARQKFIVTPATTNARVAGWMLLRTLLDNRQITIDPRCRALRMEMVNAVHDENSDDIAPDYTEDHLLDALRYVLVSTITLQPKEEKEDAYATRKKVVRVSKFADINRGR